jgi:hypothetical protein
VIIGRIRVSSDFVDALIFLSGPAVFVALLAWGMR